MDSVFIAGRKVCIFISEKAEKKLIWDLGDIDLHNTI
jgi:hypothetical protein